MAPRDDEGLKGASKHVNFEKQPSFIHSTAEGSGLWCGHICTCLPTACCLCSVLSDSGTPWTEARQAPMPMEFSRQEYWSGLPCPPPGDLPDPGIKPVSLALAGGFFTIGLPGKLPARFIQKRHICVSAISAGILKETLFTTEKQQLQKPGESTRIHPQ